MCQYELYAHNQEVHNTEVIIISIILPMTTITIISLVNIANRHILIN